ncbi:hypothetical protein IV203_003327 [Nitzschia inconspicua]|uniref:Uncharacterized protein n=1 Tax=Nitzschia inconspicua TaxID=303405 RepID=A0A9K3L3B4_9STRA|nr:hypothetical protein IV203_003327 [Nitzschia inconspicua]
MEAYESPSRQKALNSMTKNYLPFRKARHRLVTEPCTPADHVIKDHSIKTTISAMWQGPDNTNFYNDIGEDMAQFFFPCHKNGRYSDMAVTEFGFPNNSKLPPNASHHNLSSNDPPLINNKLTQLGPSLNVLQLYFLPRIREHGLSLSHLHPSILTLLLFRSLRPFIFLFP